VHFYDIITAENVGAGIPLSLTSEEITFDPNLELKFQINQFLGKCFEYNLPEKLAFQTYPAQEYVFGGEISIYLI
jgi:hypothetical protein